MSVALRALNWPRRPVLTSLLLVLCLFTIYSMIYTSAYDRFATSTTASTGSLDSYADHKKTLGSRPPSQPASESGLETPVSGSQNDTTAYITAQAVAVAANSKWALLKHQNSVKIEYKLPKKRVELPRIQTHFSKKASTRLETLQYRLDAVKSNFTHAWTGYKKHAWLKDEVAPLTGQYRDAFGGWAASLVDALGTLWIMDLHEEFEEAVEAVDKIDFTTCALDELNVFETTIRYLGGFLSAYDLSEGKYPVLLTKATELGEMLYHAFDTPNRMPVLRWRFKSALNGVRQEASESSLLAELGSLTLEFTRLSQLTGDAKYYDAVQRVMNVFESQQNKTKLPGLWPTVLNAKKKDFTDYNGFTLGGMADSAYEYLPKQHVLLGGATDQYRTMYETAIDAMDKHIFWRPMTDPPREILLPGQVFVTGASSSKQTIEPQAQHLGCFVGGMVALGARLFWPQDATKMTTARSLVEGCLWGYESHPLGVMPEIFHATACENRKDCPWKQDKWVDSLSKQLLREIKSKSKSQDAKEASAKVAAQKVVAEELLPQGVTKVDDRRYLLRPEAIESVFYLYRITGEEWLQERAWKMFENIVSLTQTKIAHAQLVDCTAKPLRHEDKMESFWLAETLRYFYLIFADEQLISLDDFVLNTEAHPLRRPRV